MVEEINDFKGGMAENFVHVQPAINGYKTYYWESARGAEIDFVIQREGQLIPIEVKSADNTRAIWKLISLLMQSSFLPKTSVLRTAKRLFLCMLHFASKRTCFAPAAVASLLMKAPSKAPLPHRFPSWQRRPFLNLKALSPEHN